MQSGLPASGNFNSIRFNQWGAARVFEVLTYDRPRCIYCRYLNSGNVFVGILAIIVVKRDGTSTKGYRDDE